MPLPPRPLAPDDFSAALALNNAALPNVNELDTAALTDLVAMSALAAGAHGDDGTLLGFVLALPPGRDYDSRNYRWVSNHRAQFLYVDRVVVTPRARGRGVGRALYRAVIDTAHAEGYGFVLAEVNERPPNPGSMAFHTAIGFRVVGHADYGPDDKAVAFVEYTRDT
ncbi:GNAT family N-acetyltransferase [Roseospira marina]|uniref:GNAT family N-acetyltransferase n=1 Tax=Roseospira marina TaxID=140057 RepID=A0A5M6IBJ4_9PROT|nr:GNAT family N-acetyltransferase [Roseospira marina]KAA5605626.1 GNAT family N-acetyltransferase [Roseospira marina]MBB4313303.1 hypothetical protein [Roseospira marina]MBB5085956.1 hypothetical protein [Roseospira marina]